MNSILEMFSVLTGVKAIFKLGYIPENDEFYELTSEQYKAYYDRMGKDDDTPPDAKIFMLLPKDMQKYKELASEDVFVITESELYFVRKAEELIEIYCADSGKTFDNLDEKLYYVASVLPNVASKGTKYEKKNSKGK